MGAGSWEPEGICDVTAESDTCSLGTQAGRQCPRLGLNSSFSAEAVFAPKAFPRLGEARPHQEGDPRNPEAVVYALITSAGTCASASGRVSAPQLGSLPGRPDVPTVLAPLCWAVRPSPWAPAAAAEPAEGLPRERPGHDPGLRNPPSPPEATESKWGPCHKAPWSPGPLPSYPHPASLLRGPQGKP